MFNNLFNFNANSITPVFYQLLAWRKVELIAKTPELPGHVTGW